MHAPHVHILLDYSLISLACGRQCPTFEVSCHCFVQ